MLKQGFIVNTFFLFRAFYSQEEFNKYIQSHFRINFSHEATNQARFKKKELCKIYLKAKDENDQINDIFLKTLEDNVLMTD